MRYILALRLIFHSCGAFPGSIPPVGNHSWAQEIQGNVPGQIDGEHEKYFGSPLAMTVGVNLGIFVVAACTPLALGIGCLPPTEPTRVQIDY